MSRSRFKKRDFSGLGVIDYALMSFGCALAAASAGMAIGQQSISIFSAALILFGTCISYAIRIVGAGKRWMAMDGILYTLAGIGSAVFSVSLMKIMPEGGFPRELFAAGWLSWMMILGSAVTWRDTTLLFQAVPAIALFGLVGVYDTYRPVVFAFFGFLVCLTTFFARAHRRQMLKESANSGYFNLGLAPGTPPPSTEMTPGLVEKLKQGPWRWMAGPEWALASALIVALISLLGAPVIQYSMKGVSGLVQLNTPKVAPPVTAPAMSSGPRDSVLVGRGPLTLLDKAMYEVVIDKPRYLRNATYDVYTGRGWTRNWSGKQLVGIENSPIGIVAWDIISEQNYQRFEWQMRPLETVRSIPLPGEPIEAQPGPPLSGPREDGTLQFRDPNGSDYYGMSVEAADGATPVDAVQDPLLALIDTNTPMQIPDRVRQLARDVTAGKQTDYEKALAIKQEIERRVKYSIQAPAVPDGQDPAEYTLFESKLAYCDLFATSMATMARAAGLPARYVTGFLMNPDRQVEPGRYVIQERDAHAWCEILFKDVGWVVFDATEGAEAVDGEGVGASSETKPWYQSAAFLTTLNWLIGGSLLLGFGWAGFNAYKRKINPNYRSELQEVYLSFTRSLHKHSGQRRLMGVTAQEYIDSVKSTLGAAAPLAQEVSAEFEAAFYSPVPESEDMVSRMKLRTAEFKKALESQKHLRRR